jgi:hypothetical protein
MFETQTDLVAVALLDSDSASTGHVGLIAVHRDFHGATLDGWKLSGVVLATALEELASAGYQRATAMVAVPHAKSKSLLARLGFVFESMIDRDYELHAVTL